MAKTALISNCINQQWEVFCCDITYAVSNVAHFNQQALDWSKMNKIFERYF